MRVFCISLQLSLVVVLLSGESWAPTAAFPSLATSRRSRHCDAGVVLLQSTSTVSCDDIANLPPLPSKGGFLRRFRDTFAYLKDTDQYIAQRSKVAIALGEKQECLLAAAILSNRTRRALVELEPWRSAMAMVLVSSQLSLPKLQSSLGILHGQPNLTVGLDNMPFERRSIFLVRLAIQQVLVVQC